MIKIENTQILLDKFEFLGDWDAIWLHAIRYKKTVLGITYF
jgi:hypothetical protein